jgi:hypothetical protein
VTVSSPCVEWDGYRNERGYGVFCYPGGRGKRNFRHRYEWEQQRGPIPPETPCVLHHCDNPPCYNIDHLFLGTRADNNADRVAKGRSVYWNTAKTHCKYGHPYSSENVRQSGTERVCRICATETSRRQSAKRHEIAVSEGRIWTGHRTHCPKGHPYAGENLKISKRGTRVCRECQIEGNRMATLRRQADPVRMARYRETQRNRVRNGP